MPGVEDHRDVGAFGDLGEILHRLDYHPLPRVEEDLHREAQILKRGFHLAGVYGPVSRALALGRVRDRVRDATHRGQIPHHYGATGEQEICLAARTPNPPPIGSSGSGGGAPPCPPSRCRPPRTSCWIEAA